MITKRTKENGFTLVMNWTKPKLTMNCGIQHRSNWGKSRVLLFCHNSFSSLIRHLFVTNKFFSFNDITWSKELSDRLTFLKQNFCHKKPKVARKNWIINYPWFFFRRGSNLLVFFSKSYSSFHIKTEVKINKTNIVLPKIIPLFRVITFTLWQFVFITAQKVWGLFFIRKISENW